MSNLVDMTKLEEELRRSIREAMGKFARRVRANRKKVVKLKPKKSK